MHLCASLPCMLMPLHLRVLPPLGVCVCVEMGTGVHYLVTFQAIVLSVKLWSLSGSLIC